jgi:hypothetical protein
MSSAHGSRVAAIAGRRIDAPDAKAPRFPSSAASEVKTAVQRLLRDHDIRLVVASAACGADILALEAASDLGIRTRIILPFDRERFRATSVVDRGEEWGQRYDAVLERADAEGDVLLLEGGNDDDDAAYGRATERIVADALAFARAAGSTPLAIAIWDERPRDSGDATRDFIDRASAAGMDLVSIPTLAET